MLQELRESMSAHTPGPWVWRDDTLIAPNTPPDYDGVGDENVIVETDSGYYPPRANDRPLIAAAPEQNSALRFFIAAIDAGGGIGGIKKEWPDLAAAYRQAVAAIALAKGEGRA